jgi:flagellar basal body rod protein FlgG
MSASGIYPALSGAMAESRALDLISNNLANLSTTAFRGQRMGFRETLARTLGQPPGRDQRFVVPAEPVLDLTPGTVRPTGNETDLALSGPGFLAVRAPTGVRYLRGGAFVRAADGRLLQSAGHELLLADDQPVRVPPGATLTISPRGEVFAGSQRVGQLKLVEFTRPQALRPEGAGLFAAPAGDPGQAAQKTEILTGHLEAANINPLRAMTEVITTSRHYEALHRVLETYKEIDSAAAREIATA